MVRHRTPMATSPAIRAYTRACRSPPLRNICAPATRTAVLGVLVGANGANPRRVIPCSEARWSVTQSGPEWHDDANPNGLREARTFDNGIGLGLALHHPVCPWLTLRLVVKTLGPFPRAVKNGEKTPVSTRYGGTLVPFRGLTDERVESSVSSPAPRVPSRLNGAKPRQGF